METRGLVRGAPAAAAPRRAWAAGLLGGVVLVAVAAGGGQDPPAAQPEGKPAECKKGDPATAQEAPAVVSDFKSNPPVVTINNGFEGDADFDKDKDAFAEDEVPLPDPKANPPKKGGLGPTFNGTSCARCHFNPVTGGSSQVAEIRAGHRVPDPNDPDPRKVRFREPVGGSVIQQLAIDPLIQKRVLPEDTVRTLRMSNTVLGGGFVEVIPDCDILEYRNT